MTLLNRGGKSIRLTMSSCAAAMLVTANLNASVAVQWSSAAGGNDHWYMCFRFATPTDWYVAKSIAESWGGYLATITSAQENQFVYDLSVSQGGWNPDHPVQGPYLGAVKNSSNQFEWVTGEAFTYTNWLPGEPSSGLWEPYLAFIGGGPGTSLPNPYWNDTEFVPGYGPQISAMFEFNSAPLPAPGVITLAGLAGILSKRRRR
jgi:hypothetical protein